jgi:hypothetical protein
LKRRAAPPNLARRPLFFTKSPPPPLFTLDFSFFVVTSISVGVLLMMGLWLYYDRRDQHVYENERSQSLFHCLKCGRVYSAPRSSTAANCPDCGFENSKLKF